MLPRNRNLKLYSRELRNNMTGPERLLWSKVRLKQLKGCQFYRQRIIGNYIADFYCPEARLVIEVDGSQHFTREAAEYDKIRDAYLEGAGLKVLRFTDIDVLRNIGAVVNSIINNIKASG